MAQNQAPSELNLGFLTVLHEPSGYLGGYLVTNSWGRPLEFRLSTAVQPNRVQQILYGGTLEPYICADLIGKTLVDKTAASARLILTDNKSVLELRKRLEIPVAWLPPQAATAEPGRAAMPARTDQAGIYCHPQFPGDSATCRTLLERLEGCLDLEEPFARIREAIGEARKMGVTARI